MLTIAGRPLAQVVAALIAVGAAHASPANTPASARPTLDAEEDLARGDVAGAIEKFELLTRARHDADGELGLVRAYMQDGQYRRALAFCAHVAAEHFDAPGAVVLYAALLRAGGQERVADAAIADAVGRMPADAFLQEASAAFKSLAPVPDGNLVHGPHRIAPLESAPAGQKPVPKEARVVSSGVLLGDGLHAIVPRSPSLAHAAGLWVRDGLGRTREAEVDRSEPAPGSVGAVILRLHDGLPIAHGNATEAAAPLFAGTPAYVLEYAEGSPATPAWPRLRLGFVGDASGASGLPALHVDVGTGRYGGLVLDASGTPTGIVLREVGGGPTMLPVSRWPSSAPPNPSGTGDGGQPSPPVASSSRPGPTDAIYERALPRALQVIVAP